MIFKTFFGSKAYRTRDIEIETPDGDYEYVTVSTEGLQEALLNNGTYVSNEAKAIDEGIYCFVPDDKIDDEDLADYVAANFC